MIDDDTRNMIETTDDAIRNMMYEAFERAFQEQIGKLFGVYLSNVVAGSPDQAARTKKGIENAVEAYRLAVSAVDSWSSEGG